MEGVVMEGTPKDLEGVMEEREKVLEDILREALSDDEYNDHSSGIWQEKAREALKILRDK